MAVSGSNVVLYAADSGDYQYAMAAAAVANIPLSNVTGDFNSVWNQVASGKYLVIAVGATANNALYYNPCGWSNPAGDPAGATPFAMSAEPQATLPGANYYENAAGQSGSGTLKLATMLAYFATFGAYPSGYGTTPPPTANAANTCYPIMNANQPCPCA